MVTLTELADSRKQTANRLGQSAGCTFTYLAEAEDGDDEQDVYLQVKTTSIDPYNRGGLDDNNNLALRDINITPLEANLFHVDVVYEANQDSVSFDCSLQTEKVYYSRLTVPPPMPPYTSSDYGYFISGGSAPDLKGAINVNEHSVEGVDIQSGKFSFTITKFKNRTDVTSSFISTIQGLTGWVNDSDISFTVGSLVLSYDAGELRFDGSNATIKPTGDQVEVPYKFSFSQGVNDPDDDLSGPGSAFNAGNIRILVKDGWSYLWIKYDQVPASDGSVFQKAVAAYVEQVYPYGDFSVLGL